MAKNRKDLAESLLADESGGWLTGFLADEDEFDRRTLWRLGSWGLGSVGAVIIAVLANQSGGAFRHDQVAAADLTRQSQRLQTAANTNENETRRLASAVDTLNGDRDRLYARVTVLEQGLDSVTGSIDRKIAAQNNPKKTASSSPQVAAPPSPPIDKPAVSQASAAPPAVRWTVPSTVTANTVASPAIQPDAAKNTDTSLAPPSPVVAPVAAMPPATETEPTAAKSSAAKAALAKLTLAKTSPVNSTPANTSPAESLTEPSSPDAAPMVITPRIASTRQNAALDLPKIKPDHPDDLAASLASAKPAAQANPEAKSIVAAIPEAADTESAASPLPEDAPVAHTEFGVDLGGARSINSLRALWRRMKSDAREVASLRPIIVLKERANGSGMQLRLVAGPLNDAAAAAKICAVLVENNRSCETTVFDGQRLAMTDDGKQRGPTATAKKPKPSPSPSRHRRARTTAQIEEPASPPPPQKPSTIGSFFSR